MQRPHRRWTAGRVRALRDAYGESQARFARRVGVDESTIFRWERGKTSPTHTGLVCRLDDLAELLSGQVVQGGGHSDRNAPLSPHAPAADEGTNMHRRDALELLAAAAVTGLTGSLHWDRLAAPKIDAGLVSAHERAMAALASTYIAGDPRAMLPAAAGFADGLTPLLRRVPTEELGLRLASVSVDAHSMAGIMAFHVGNPLLTQRHLALAGHIADASLDPQLRAQAWAMLAHYVHSPLPDGHGSARQTVALLGRAKALGRNADGHTRAWLATGYAEEAVELGDVGVCRWAVDSAWAAFDRATVHRGGLFSPAGLYGDVGIWLRGVSGRVAGLAGDMDEAERAIGHEVSRAQNGRQRINALCALGSARVHAGQPEGAAGALGEAIAAAHTTGNLAKLPQVGAVRAKMPPTWDGLACVADLDERLCNVA